MLNSSVAPVGLFDSGVGGISVANALHQILPHENLIYVADSAHAPYGNKSSAYILQRCRAIVEFLLSQQAKIIVVACNTATLSCIEILRREYDVPFVGVEPGIKPAVLATRTGKVAVLATPLTVVSNRYLQLLDKVSDGKQVLSQPCEGLADQIELGQFDSPQTLELLNKYVKPLLEAGVDQIALGCTHYGFLSHQLEKLLQGHASLVDTGAAIARQAKVVLEGLNKLNDTGLQGNVFGYSSDMSQHCRQTMRGLMQSPMQSIEWFSN